MVEVLRILGEIITITKTQRRILVALTVLIFVIIMVLFFGTSVLGGGAESGPPAR